MMQRERGFTLVELMVSVAIGLTLTLGVMTVLVSGAGIYQRSDGRARMQENARFAMTVLQQDLRMAGYMGCFNLNMFPTRYTNLVKDPDEYGNDYATMVGGFEATSSSFTPTLDTSIGHTSATPVAGSDILFMRGPTGPSAPLNDAMTTVAAPIPLASVEGFTVGGLAIVSDCGYANVFKVTQIPADKKLVHAANYNTAAQLTRVFSNVDGATVTPIGTVTYFVAPSGDGISGHRSLYRQESGAVPEEIAAGIENMQLEYGIDTDSDKTANKFVTANNIGTGEVTAVKVSLLVTSASTRSTMQALTYYFDGAAFTAADRRVYTPVTTTVTLRNQVY
jgi:type IV pilus assembly protein PilW